MIKLTDKLLMVTLGRYLIYCPKCEDTHELYTYTPNALGLRWWFNLHLDQPSFFPDLKIYYSDGRVCHSVIVYGKQIFEHDCSHGGSGDVIELADFPKELMQRLLSE